jgi:hypothetical protein
LDRKDEPPPAPYDIDTRNDIDTPIESICKANGKWKTRLIYNNYSWFPVFKRPIGTAVGCLNVVGTLIHSHSPTKISRGLKCLLLLVLLLALVLPPP